MRVYVKGVPYMGMTTTLTDKELMIIVQAEMRGLCTSKIRVTFMGEQRMLATEAIDLARTLPLVVFEKPSLVPPPLDA
jgi:hypothetical protein